MKTCQGKSVDTPNQIIRADEQHKKYILSSPFTFCWQDFRAFCGWVGDDLFWWKWLLHLLQQSAMAQPLPVCLQAPGPGPGSAS